jgi:putative hydrolase of the HAD superfamily
MRPRAVLLDAHGTLIGLHPPVPRLARLLAEAGAPHSEDVVARALAGEIAHYRANHMTGADAASLAALRRECAGVLAAGLGPGAPPVDDLVPMLLGALRFHLMDDAAELLDALAARGIPVGLVSNWDVSLREVLAELGIADRFAAVCISAECGVAKPDPAIFAAALGALGARADEVIHCGDDARLDGWGALAAGITPVLIVREGRADPCFRSIRRLTELTRAVPRRR